MNKPLEYLNNLQKILTDIITEQLPQIEKCSEVFAEALKNENTIFLFGTGHSHMLAEELFYRAGGLVKIQPVLETSLMLHESASKSTEIERLEGYAKIIFDSYSMKKDDVIVIISNSGRNGIPVDMAQLAKENKKFQISKVASGARFKDYRGCIEWLRDAGIVNICYCLNFPELPLKGNYDESKYKLYFFDTGIFVAMLDEEAQEDLRANKNLGVYKGALYENIVGEALIKCGYGLYYYKKEVKEFCKK